jgi:hypothetical protein
MTMRLGFAYLRQIRLRSITKERNERDNRHFHSTQPTMVEQIVLNEIKYAVLSILFFAFI